MELEFTDITKKPESEDLSGYETVLIIQDGKVRRVSIPILFAELIKGITGGNGSVDLSGYAKVEQIPKNTSDLSNDSGFITRIVDNLTNYYGKDETYNREEIDLAIEKIPKIWIDSKNPPDDSYTVWIDPEGEVEDPDQSWGANYNPVAKTEDMTQPVGVDENGRLWVAPIGGGSGGGDTPVVPGSHGIIWDLVNVTSSNNVASVSDGAYLSAVLTPAEGYALGTVTVTMGGEVLTGVWNADTAIVTIPSVTGDVVISCAGAAQGSGEVVDTTAVIEVAGKGINNAGRVYASEYWGYTKFYPVNDTQFTLRFTNTAGVSAPTSNAIMTVFLNTEDGTAPFTVKDYSNPLGTTNVGKEYTTKNIADGATGLRATILLSEIDNYYLYETNTKKVIFAGKNTPYYGMTYVESTGEVVDTSPVIAQENMGLANVVGNTLAVEGFGITKIYEFTPDIDGLKATTYYDAINDYMTADGVGGCIKFLAPSAKMEAAGLAPNTNNNKIHTYRDGTAVKYASNGGMKAGTEVSVSLGRQNTDHMYTNGIAFTLSLLDAEDSYAYWSKTSNTNINTVFPIGVRDGDIIFAGKNTQYYGMANIDGTLLGGGSVEIGLSLDDDIAQNYAVATASVLGEDTATDTKGAYGISSDLAAVIDEVRTAWMIEYGGDPRKIPLIITTDQHGRTNAGIFNMLGKTLSLHDVSKICNLGDTCAVEWRDEDTTQPLISCTQLENWCESIKAIPFSKRLDVYGNHDAWYYDGYSVEGNTIGTRYPVTMHHLDQYFRNIYARRNNSHGWGVIRDDYFNVKYLIVTGFEFKNGVSNQRISTAQMKNIIAELSKDDGYDIVVMSHMPLYYQVSSATYPTGMNPEDTTATGITRFSGVDTDTLFNARKNKTSGTITDSDGVEHSFDFSSCTTEILCGLNGHMHLDAYNHIGGNGLANMTFDWFDGNTVHFVLIDRENRQLNVWKMEGTALSYTNYQVPLDKPTE